MDKNDTQQNVARQAALDYHEFPKPGKLEIRPTKPMATPRDLARAYSPGVAEACLEIAANPATATRYTAKRYLVAVISNGTAVLGLGNIGAQASKRLIVSLSNAFAVTVWGFLCSMMISTEQPSWLLRRHKML